MEKKGYYFSQDIYSEHLKKIDGITFTRREMDIIAFLIRGRTAKKIASFLSISPKTVENHTRNIMIKLQCNSRERIIDFIEKSGKFSSIKDYHTTLIVSMAFEKALKAVAASKKEGNPAFCIVHWPNQTITSSLAHQLENHLKVAGIPVSLKAREKVQSIFQLMQEAHQGAYKIYVLPDRTLDMPQSKQDLEDQAYQPVQGNLSSSSDCLFLLPTSEEFPDIPKGVEGFHYVDSAEHQNYYFFVFAILTKLFPNFNFDKIILEFKETSDALNPVSDPSPPQTSSEENKWEGQKADTVYETRGFMKNKRWLIPAVLLLTLGLPTFGVLTYKAKKNHIEESHHKYQPQNQKSQHFPLVRSDLMIPSESAFLNRPQLIAQIENKFNKEQEGIQIVALVGIGGSGKTTLARQYARAQKSSFVWEINLATQESFMGSLENLAYALSKTETEKKILRGLQDIKASKEREKKIILFLKERIKSYHNWFVIYDNLDNVSKIQKIFPSDPYVCGNGRILITTRDSNIQNSDRVNSVIQIGELNQAEKFNLFVNIFNRGESKLSSHKKEQITDFLHKIPPFPLDITVAATYLKTTDTPFKRYLEHLKDCNQNFINTQENVLKECGKYAETRYSIITLSLKQLIDAHKDFGDLLLLISLLDSQNIPRSLLVHYKSEITVDNFIYNLKKYSLIADNPSSASDAIPAFSIHQSTQEIGLIYLTKTLNLQKNDKIFSEIFHTLEKYITEITDRQDFVYLRILINHFEKLLSHKKYLSDSMIETLNGELGRMYLRLGDDKKAIHLINTSIESLTNHYHGNHPLIPRFLSYLGNAYFDLGYYEKSKDSYEKSLKIYRQYFPKNYSGIADALSGLAVAYRSLGNYKSAKDLLEQSLNLYKKNLPDSHLKIAWALKHLGYNYKFLGDYEKAKELLEQSLVLYKKNNPQGSEEVNTWDQVGLANLFMELGDYQKAKELFEQSLIVYKKNLPGNHHKIAKVLKYLGILYRELEDHKKEKEFLEKSLSIYEKDYPEGRLDIAVVLKYLGNSYRRLGNYKKSKELLERSLLIQKDSLGDDNINIYSTYLFLGNLYVDLGRYEEGKTVIRKCLRAYEGYYGKNHIESLRALRYLGRASFKEGDMKTAEAIFQKLFKISESFPVNVHPYTYKHPHIYRLYEDLGVLYHHFSLREMQSGNREAFKNYHQQARGYMTQALKIVKASHPKGIPIITRIESKLKSLENKELKNLKLE